MGVGVMSPESVIEDLSQIVGDLEIPCDYDRVYQCGPAVARWLMVAKCGCGNTAHRLACGGCKNLWVSSEGAAECGECGEIFTPARRAFSRIEWLS